VSEIERHASGVEESDPDTFATVLVGVIGSLMVVVAVVFLQGLYERAQRAELRQKIVDTTPQELQTLRVRQLEKLSRTAWVDKSAGVVAIPVDRAMELLVRDPSLVAVPPPESVTPPVTPVPAGAAQ
jgi:uncharacterized protein involved in exopolysaccharide biosynthesis